MANIEIPEKQNVRIEKDFLGTKEVPTYAYYGIQTLTTYMKSTWEPQP